jgi:LPXTG-site transpeptidase (sortase) family protein
VQALAARTYGKRLIQHISLPSIGVDSGVVAVGWHMTGPADPQANSAEWDSPGPAVGWVVTSGLPDTGGNVILYGHNNMYGSVFKNLWKLQPGDEVTLQTGQDSRQYQVDRVLLLPMLNANPTQKQAYLAYLAETAQPRLTIISCWPPESNTQRVVVIAYPVTIP